MGASLPPTPPPLCSRPTTCAGPIWALREAMLGAISILPQQLVFGLALGAVYGLIALGYTMVYGVLSMINFAHGEVFMIGAYIGWVMLTLLIGQVPGPFNPLWVLPVLLVPAMLLCGGLGVAIERVAYRPLYARGASRLSPLISAVGASIFLQNAVMLIQGARMKVYMTNELFPRNWRFSLFGVNVSVLTLVIIALALLLMWGLIVLIERTSLGRSIRAVAEDRETASLMGIDVGRTVSITFFLGSALGGAAGVLIGLYYTQIDFMMGHTAGLKAFTAAVLGGIGNIKGAMLGGLLLGVIESLASTFINPAFKDVVAFAVLILTLVFKPEGLFGELLADRKKI
jgi:branched-chain amino acid transport system permease protein